MKNDYRLLLLIGILFLSSSCSRRYYYAPHSAHHLEVSDKGELSASAAVGRIGLTDVGNTDSKENQYQVQTAYSPIKHLAVSGSLSFIPQSSITDDFVKGYDVDFAVGTYYFVNLGLSKESQEQFKENNEYDLLSIYLEKGILLDTYVSIGKGRIVNSSLGNGSIFAYNKYAVQFGVYYRARPIIGSLRTSLSFGGIVRPSGINFTNATIIGNGDSNVNNFIELINLDGTLGMIEYTATAQLGFGGMRFFVNGNWITTRNESFGLYIDDQAWQTGVLVEIDRWFDKDKKKKASPQKH